MEMVLFTELGLPDLTLFACLLAFKCTLKYTSYEECHSLGIRGRRYVSDFLRGNLDPV
jgi:hypothetical protein